MTTIVHTKDQRRRLFLLARLLDRVPRKHFDIESWLKTKTDNLAPAFMHEGLFKRLRNLECGFAGCAMGWAMTSKPIRGKAGGIQELIEQFGFNWVHFGVSGDTGTALFGASRKNVTPKRVARDIRRYLNEGKLPRK